MKRRDLVEFFKGFVNTVMWTSNAGVTELPVARTAYKDAIGFPLGKILWFHDYALMGGGDLAPGDYVWDWTATDPFGGVIVALSGAVEIVSHEEHLARLADGTW